MSAGKIFKNETVQSEKEGLQREELNWTWAAQTPAYLTPVLKEQVNTAGQVSTYSLVGLIICLLYVNSHQVSTPLSQSLFLPLCQSMQEPLELYIVTQTGKMPFTAMLQLASTGSKVQQMMSSPSAANNLCRQMGFL